MKTQYTRFLTFYLSTLLTALCLLASNSVRAVEPGVILDNVIVNPSSDRTYRAIELPNGLRAILIHDPDTDKAAASLDIQVGSANDPIARQGMAHFLEHMLFLGTEPFPEPGEYQAFLSANGGSSNAYTTFDHTNYFFDVDGEQLKGALDRFSAFFSAPLFTPDLVDRERNAVHSEYTAKIKDDSRRYFDALKQIVNPQHPFAKFTVGNLSTLSGDDLAAEVRQFWQDNYSANLMALAVIGPQPLDQLAQWVAEGFSGIPNYQYTPVNAPAPMFDADDLPSLLEVNALRDRRSLSLMFPIPEVDSLYRIKPTAYLGSLLGHEGEGSWFAQLRARGWAESLSAGLGIAQRDGATFMVNVELTPQGREHLDEIVEMGFALIHQIETQGIEPWRHQEQGQLLENEFVFLSDGPVQSHATSMARSLQRYPVEDLIRGTFAWDSYDPATLRRFVEFLTPDNMLMSYTGPDVQSSLTSPWYDTPYQQRPIDLRRLTRFRSARAGLTDAVTKLPEPNPFIADRFDLIGDGEIGGVPQLIRQDQRVEHWHLSDREFAQPKADIYLRLNSIQANVSPQASVASQIIADLIKDQLNTQTYPALLAGLSYDVYRTLSGITVVASGYSQTVPQLADLLVQALSTPKIAPERFELIRQDRIRDLNNQTLDAPYERLMRRLPNAMIQGYWSKEEQLEEVESLTLADTLAHWNKLLADTGVDILTHGNLTQAQALRVSDQLAGRISAQQATEVPLPAIQPLQPGLRISQDSEHEDQAWVGYYTRSDSSPAYEAKLRVFGQMIKTPFYTQLRTQQQLGYIVFAGYMPLLTQPGLVFTVQSPDASPQQIENAAFEFFDQFNDSIQTLTLAQFNEFKGAVLTGLTEEDPNLSSRSARFWRSIGLKDLEFDRQQQVIDAVQAMTLADARALAKDFAKARDFMFIQTTSVNESAAAPAAQVR